MKRIAKALVVSLFILGGLAPHLEAETQTWDGGNGATDLWSGLSCSNWRTNTCPAEGDNVTLNDSTPTATAVHDSGLTCSGICDYGALIISNDMTLNLDWDSVTFTSMKVGGSFTLQDDGTTHNLDVGPITINNSPTIDHDSSGDIDASSMKIDANSASKTLTLYNDGRYDIAGVVEVFSGTSANLQAKLIVNSTATNFLPQWFDIRGVPTDIPSSYAVLDFDADVTVQGRSGTDTSVDGFVDFLLAASVVFDAKEMVLFDSDTDLVVTGAGSTTTTLKYDSLTLNGGAISFVGPLTVEVY